MLEGNTTVRWFKETARSMLPRDRFISSIMTLAGGAALGQLVVIIAAPILTRLYTPENFGDLAVYTSLLSILSVLASWRYEIAILLPKKDEEAANLTVLCLVIVILMSLLVYAVTLLFGHHIVFWINAPRLKPYLWLLPLGVAIIAIYNIFANWAIRKQAFSQIARTRLNQGIALVISQVCLGLLKSGSFGLLIGQILGQTTGIITLMALFQKRNGKALENVNIYEIKRMAILYRRFPLVSVIPAFINSLGLQLTVLALSVLFGSLVTGWFSLTNRVIGLPLSLISSSSGQVLISYAADCKRSNTKIESLFWRIIRQQCTLGLPILLFSPACPFVFPLIFGADWKEAGIYAAVWLPALIANFIGSPTGGFLDVLERQDLFLIREICRLIFLGAALALSVSLKLNALLTIAILSGTMVLFAFIYAGLSLWAIKNYR